MELISFLSILIYAAFYFTCSIAVRKKNKTSAKMTAHNLAKSDLKVALVIPYHNEVVNLQSLLVSIAEQSFIPEQILLINDHSTDGSFEFLKTLLPMFKQLPVQLLSLNAEQHGKKAALTAGIEHSDADLILTTDADCTFSEHWVETTCNCFLNTAADMICGGVTYSPCKTWIEHYQRIESNALVNTGEAMHLFGMPVMCNGANLAFKKSTWQAVNGYKNNDHILSGDDVFLMHNFYRLNKKKVDFLIVPENMVFTKPTKDIASFLAKRKRWLSKNGQYQFWWANVFPIMVAALNFILFLSIVLFLWDGKWGLALIILLIKNMADFGIVNANIENQKPISALKILFFQPWQWLYPLLLLFVKSDWKSR